jgi:hypothetical protein
MQHFEIMVNAMLSWADEAKSPKKVPARPASAVMMRGERDELDDDEPFIDDDDFEPDEELNIKPETDEPMAGEPAEAQPESELD